ncbi:MAG: metallophosphoesterase [Deltaproteobacteria bacterium]|nr:metallophosphoesterase [Deltaproteobacteria bacterium]
MPASIRPLRIAHLSDSHLGQEGDPEILHPGTVSRLESVVAVLESLGAELDLIVHTGDVTHATTPENYKIVVDRLSRLSVPTLLVPGNHDDRSIFPLCVGPTLSVTDWGISGLISYHADLPELTVVALDAFSSSLIPYGARVSAGQLARLRKVLSERETPVIVLMHYPPFSTDCVGTDGTIEVEDADALHAVLVEARQKIRAVLHGHTHLSTQIVRDGILYAGVGSISQSFKGLPQDKEFALDPVPLPMFNLISIGAQSTLIKQCFCR